MTTKVNEVELNRKKANKRILKGSLLGGFSLSVLFAEVALATTTLSGLTGKWQDEASTVVPIILLLIAGIGVIIAAVAVISGIMAKKNQEPLRWQLWGVIGGALAVIIPVLVLATAGSLSGGSGGAGSTMSELNIKY